MSSSGKKGYLELGNTWKSLVIDRKNVVVDGSLPGSDEVMFLQYPFSLQMLMVLNIVQLQFHTIQKLLIKNWVSKHFQRTQAVM